MKRRTKITIGTAALAAGLIAIPTAAQAGNDVDIPIEGDALQRATDAALSHLGEGRFTETEVGDEESMYEVEVTLANGMQVDVQLDENFVVVGTEEEKAGEDGK